MSKIVRAIDLGYGLTKFVQSIDNNGNLVYQHFPSLAVASDPQTMRSLNIRRRDTVDVQVGDAQFEVGPDVLQAQTGNDIGREIGNNWSKSPNYRALMLGSLHYMNLDVIDVLVLGLPVNQYLSEDRCAELVSTYTGTHSLPNGRTVTVREVVVRPQPLGSYVDLGSHIEDVNKAISAKKEKVFLEKGLQIGFEPLQGVDDLIDKCVLVVDPGEYTMDWLFVDHGTINTKASGAASDSGRNRIVNAVKRAMEIDLGEPIPPVMMPKLDESLRNGTALKLNGLQIDLSKYKACIDQEVTDVLASLYQGLRGLEGRVDMILLVGGHPALYEAALSKRFPYIPIFLPKEPVYANLRGFYLIGLGQ